MIHNPAYLKSGVFSFLIHASIFLYAYLQFDNFGNSKALIHTPINVSLIQEQAKKPSYRVLEDPFEAAAASAAPSNPAKKAPNYRVLEDPMTTAMYDPSTSSEAQAAAAAMPASSCPPASEVLEGAREKFDKFWGSRSSRNTNDTTEP